MENKKIITLDLTGCKHLGEMHERIRVTFNFPKWYGANWDAFWDLLWSDVDANKVVILGANTMPEELENCVEKMKSILERLKNHRKQFNFIFDYEFVDN